MKVCFVIPTEPASIGCRVLSSYLRLHGHDTRLLFVPNLIPTKDNIRYARNVKFECSEKLRHIIVEVVQDSDLIGFSVLTQFYEPLADLSTFIKQKLSTPIVWGGIHATMAPESCLKYADIVSIGDGEETLLELMNTISTGGELQNVLGIIFQKNGQTIQTGFRQPERNLDGYPPLDFSFKEHFWVSAVPGEEQVRELTPQVYREVQKKYPRDLNGEEILLPYKTVASRGCPYTCSYCSIGSQDKKRFPFRYRSVENVIDELQQVIAAYGDIIEVISFSDDTFLTLSEKWTTRFCELYAEKVKYPFRVIGHPLNITDNKTAMLAQAGCMHFGMGIETLSEKILYNCYNRKTPVQRVIQSANILVEISEKHHIHPPTFDIILGNPYESPADTLETFRFLTQIKSPNKYIRFSLCLFPGSDLYIKAIEDGIIDKDDSILYRSWCINEPEAAPYLNILYKFIAKNKYNVPRWYLRVLSRPMVFKFFQFLFRDKRSLYKKFFTFSSKVARKLDSLSSL